MINETLIAAFNNLAGKIALPAGAVPPFFTLDRDNDLLSLNAQVNYYDSDGLLNPILIYSNYKMFTLINTIPFTYLGNDTGLPGNGRDFNLPIINTYDNVFVPSYIITAPTSDDYYYRMTQNVSSLATISPVKSIAILSSALNMDYEFAPTKPTQQQSNLNKENILIEYEPVLKKASKLIGQVSDFRPQYPKPRDMKGETPLQTIDVAIYWRDVFNTLHLIYSNVGETAVVRLAFRKK